MKFSKYKKQFKDKLSKSIDKNIKKNGVKDYDLDMDHDYCFVCGTICNLNDMYIMFQTKEKAANLCEICFRTAKNSIKFTQLINIYKKDIKRREEKKIFRAFQKYLNKKKNS